MVFCPTLFSCVFTYFSTVGNVLFLLCMFLVFCPVLIYFSLISDVLCTMCIFKNLYIYNQMPCNLGKFLQLYIISVTACCFHSFYPTINFFASPICLSSTSYLFFLPHSLHSFCFFPSSSFLISFPSTAVTHT